MRDTKRDTNFGDLNPGGRGIRSQSGSPGAPGHNLPLPLTRFIGRSDQIARIEQQLGENRLLTLTGPGGIGKTRLAGKVAASLARSFDDGVWLVELAPLADSLLVAQAVATVLHVRGLPARPVLESLVDHLRSKQLLLILDNCEHLIDAAAGLVETLLRACPRLRILATSREALGVAGEIMFSVPGLSLPDPSRLPPSSAELIQYEAVQLFMDRAVAIQPNLELTESNARAIAHICHRLGGIPLAIELAAARVNVLNAPEIAARLDDRFALLTDGSRTALARHHTLRAAIDWSYDLLVGPERVLFRRLSAFVGGCTLSAAEYVCSLPDSKTGDKVASPPSAQLRPSEILDLFSNLVNKSLVLVEEQGGETRYQMLETIRHYAREKLLDSGESELVQNRHLDFFCTSQRKLSRSSKAARRLFGCTG